MYLLDTNVLSALGPKRPPTALALVDWIRAKTDALFLSAVTIAELEAGSAKLHRTGAHQRAKSIARWIDAMVALFGDRILSFDVAVARTAGSLHDKARASGSEPGFADVAIAATAKHHGLLILTHNVRHFRAFGVPLHDPFETLPSGSSRGRRKS